MEQIPKHTEDLFRKLLKILEPPPDLTVSTWADEYRMLSSESSAAPGRWKTSKAPYQREMMDAISDPKTHKVVVMSAAQIGKTDSLILNPIGYFMDYDPCPIMVMLPTISLAETLSKDRLTPMLRDTPKLRDKVNDKSRNSGNTILQKIFPGGHVTMVGANSATGLSSRPIRVVLADEIDRYPGAIGNEGDPLLLAEKRTTTFWNRKIVCVSTPTTRGISRIELEYNNSTQEEWNIPCPECQEFTPLTWENIIFDKDNPDDVAHSCPHCGALSGEIAWKEQGQKGKFIPKYPNTGVRGFHINSLASGFVAWSEVVRKFLVAVEEKKKGNIEPLRTWTNLEMGELWEDDGEQIETDDIFKRRERYNCEVPPEVIVLTAGVDTQDDRFEIEVVGWGEEKESWGIRYQVIYGDLKRKNVWDQLSQFLQTTFTTLDGRALNIRTTCMDSGGHFTKEVYQFCAGHHYMSVYAIKGKGGKGEPIFKKPSKNNTAGAYLFTLGVDTGKELIYQRLNIEEEGAGYCHFPREKERGYGEEYFKGLTSEKKIITYKRGKAQEIWVLKDTAYRRNEPLDCRNYATAALEILNPILKKEDDNKPQKAKSKRGRRSKGVT